ncbi:MAG: VOC family protein [Luteolibacter sp.]
MSNFSYPTFCPSFAVNDAPAAIGYYKKVFGATERYRLVDSSSGQVGHAELLIGDCLFMLCEEMPEWNKTPKTLGGTTVKFSLIVENADETIASAIAAGATETLPVSDQFYGFRSGNVRDPFGHEWMIQHIVEEVSPEEMQHRWDAMVKTC